MRRDSERRHPVVVVHEEETLPILGVLGEGAKEDEGADTDLEESE